MARLMLVLATLLAGCELAAAPSIEPNMPASRTRIEVWYRTELPIYLLARDGQRLDVEACGHEIADDFETNLVEVRLESGYISAFNTGDPAPQYLVVVSGPPQGSGYFGPSGVRPDGPLPLCEGVPQFRPGV